MAAEVAACSLCPLHGTRTNTVPGQGSPNPEIVFVGEGPGADEDEQGLAFVGKAGHLLTRMIEAMGLTRDDVFICNIVKCRPPENRTPELSEMNACLPYLKRQIGLLQPKVVVALGATALTGLVEMPKGMGITRARGTWLRFAGIDLMPTFHPAYLLRNPNVKKYVWEDLQAVLRRLDKPIPEVKKR
ncbi:MAG: uracil-DNA glycosylase [Candidatus Pacebacteria bacterium]|nr:uracil-DNA glycosylase [Candidatus Paceibacterota bacterium]